MRLYLHCLGKPTFKLIHMVLAGLGCLLAVGQRPLFFMTWLLHRPPECHHAMATGYFQSDPREPKIETALLYQPSQKYHTMPSSLLTSAACCWPHRPPLVTWAGTAQGVMPGGGDPCGLAWKLAATLRQRCFLNSMVKEAQLREELVYLFKTL